MNKENYYLAILMHVAMGFAIYFNENLAKVVFWGAFLVFIYRITLASEDKKSYEVLKAAAYIVGGEVLFRMTKAGFSYEAGKYSVIFFMFFGMLYKGVSSKSYPYLLYIMFLVPSIFVASTTLSFDANFRTNIAFVLSGPICLGVAAIFCYEKKVTRNELYNILLMILLPIIAHTTYIFLYNPSVKTVLSGNASNVATSGGFGANQVSTILGLGMFIVATRFLTKSSTTILKFLNGIIFILISYRALVTFSRGGVITAIACVAVFVLYYLFSNRTRNKINTLMMLLFFSVAISITWYISLNQTRGLIELRYENKDSQGRVKQDITTGRFKLFKKEIEGFIDQPFFGIGSSRAKDQRIEVEGQGITSHSEFSRILAEHGILGIVILLILIFKPLDIRSKNKSNFYFFSFICFWGLTINHSTLRIAAPAFIYALALLNVTHEKRSISRKLPVKKAA